MARFDPDRRHVIFSLSDFGFPSNSAPIEMSETYTAILEDRAGRQSNSIDLTLTYDNIAPEISGCALDLTPKTVELVTLDPRIVTDQTQISVSCVVLEDDLMYTSATTCNDCCDMQRDDVRREDSSSD